MSLQLAAQHLASQGRGPDTTLVHMAPGEVDSLQAIAKAHGGSLTINPETGLPEAGFLSSILPMIAGVALGPAGFGLTAMQAGLAAGALGTVATGSLRKGIMAGLGAYGGAGIGDVISGAGTNAISNAARPVATSVPTLPAATAVPTTPVVPAVPAATAVPATPTTSPVAPPPDVQATSLPPIGQASVPASGAYTVDPFGGFGGATNVAPPPAPATQYIDPAASDYARVNQMDRASDPTIDPAASDYARVNEMDKASAPYEAGRQKALAEAGKFDRFKAGLSAIMDKPDLLFDKRNMKYGAAALAPLLMQERKQATYAGSGPNPYRYSYNPGRTGAGPSTNSSESLYFRPSYTRLAEGGSTSQAVPSYATSPSLDYYRSLMGSASVPMSSALPDTLTAPAAPAATGISAAIPTSSDPYYAYLMGEAPEPAPMFTVNPVSMTPTATAAKPNTNAGLGGYYDQSGPSADPVPGGPVSVTGSGLGLDLEAPVPGSPDDPTGPDGSGIPGDATLARGGITAFARGGYNLGDYSDGGRLLRGPGDGVSDSIPATIANKRPARLADGEFVVPARIVSELGNGSTEAGARKLYAMMDRVQKNRRKSIGKGKVAVNSRSDKLLPA